MTWRNQGEHQHWTTHLCSISIVAAPETLTVLGSHGRSQTRTRERSNPRALTRTNEGGRCRSWALHQPWPREPPASNRLARLKKPPPLSTRRWCPGRKAWPNVKSRCCREKASMCTSRRLRCCRERASMKPRHRRQARANAPRRYRRANVCSRCRRERAGANPRCYQKGEREHGMTPQGCPNEGDRKPSCRRTKSSCPLGRDQAPGILEGSRQGSTPSSRKKPVETMDIAAGIDARKQNKKDSSC